MVVVLRVSFVGCVLLLLLIVYCWSDGGGRLVAAVVVVDAVVVLALRLSVVFAVRLPETELLSSFVICSVSGSVAVWWPCFLLSYGLFPEVLLPSHWIGSSRRVPFDSLKGTERHFLWSTWSGIIMTRLQSPVSKCQSDACPSGRHTIVKSSFA